MVIFRSPDGKPGYHQAETLEEAVAFVERLRNADGVTDARVFRMDEVAIEFQVYYRVAVAGATPADTASATSPEPDAPPEVQAESPADDGAAANGAGSPGRFGLFTRA